MSVRFRHDTDFCMTNMPLRWPLCTPLLQSRAITMLVTKSVQEASNISEEMSVKLNVKRDLNLGPWHRILNSLYQIQTMQPQDSMFLMGSEASLYEDCSKYFERVQGFIGTGSDVFVCSAEPYNMPSKYRDSTQVFRALGQCWTQRATSVFKGWLLVS